MKSTIKKVGAVLTAAMVALCLCGCENDELEQSVLETASGLLSTSKAESTQQASSSEQTEAQADTYVILQNESTTINGNGASFEESTLYITAPGTYSIKGTLSDGHIEVNSPSEASKVKIILCGVDIYCSTTAPIDVVESGDETVIILQSGTQNTLSDNADRSVPTDTDDYATAVIYSRDDLQFEGEGTLNIKAAFNKGIFSKDDLKIEGGTFNIESADDAIRGKDSTEILGGTFNLTAGADGIRTSNETDADKGDMIISGGSFTIVSALDGIQSVAALEITGGSFNITAGSGSSEIEAEDEGGFGGFFSSMPPDSSAFESQSEQTASQKAIKSAAELKIENAVFTLDSYDDAVHSNSDASVSQSEFTIKTNDDAFHSDGRLSLSDCTVKVEQCYEGLEGAQVEIDGGSYVITASDDGINAASGSQQSENPQMPWGGVSMAIGGGAGGGRGSMGGSMGSPMQDAPGSYNSDNKIIISSGRVIINASGDGIDSNGDIEISGGSVYVFGPENGGNGALDYAGSCVVSGGLLLAVGSSGMAQSVSESSEPCISTNLNLSADTLVAVCESGQSEPIAAFVLPKRAENIVFCCEELDEGGQYVIYSGGSYTQPADSGVCEGGVYTAGTPAATLTAA